MTDTCIDGIDYGPLATLVGQWSGDKGVDRAPEPEGEERNPYYETLMFEAIGDVTNAEHQVLAVLRYHQIVSRKSNNKVFHNETGYLSWDSATGEIVQSFAIPRGVAVVAGGRARSEGSATIIDLKAGLEDPDYTIAQAPFMRDKASTVAFTHSITVDGDQLSYTETTVLDIYGRRYNHIDLNRLTRTR